MNLNDCSDLAEIIQQIDGAERILSQKVSKDCEDMLRFVDEISNASPATIEQIIDELRQDRSNGYTEFIDRRPYISMALSYAYCKKNESTQAQKYAQEGKAQFGRSIRKWNKTQNQWNKAVAHWFLGIVYRNNNLTGRDMAELKQAAEIFSGILSTLTNTTKVRSDYQLANLCGAQIKKIDQTLSDPQNYEIETQSIDESAVAPDKFSELVLLIEIPEDLKYLYDLREEIVSIDWLDLPQINSVIAETSELLWSVQQTPLVDALARCLLAHCYNLAYYAGKQKDKEAEECLKEAIPLFEAQHDDYNEAISNWYLALLHNNSSDYQQGLHCLNQASQLLERYMRQFQEDNQHIESLQDGIRDWTQFINSHIDLPTVTPQADDKKTQSAQSSVLEKVINFFTPNVPDLEKTPYPDEHIQQNAFDTEQLHLRETQDKEPEDERLPRSNRAQPMHITIPVDVEALKNPGLKSTPLVEEFFYKQLREYNERPKPETVPKADDIFEEFKDYIIPSFPLYGYVTAGPKGEPFLLEEVACLDGVNESLAVSIGERVYRIRFINDVRITFVEGKNYGWFRVKGESMNTARGKKAGNPIRNNDYVLFCENHDAEVCKDRIVVAFLPEVDDKMLIVKRLIKMSSDSQFRRSGFGSKIKYLLQSESSFDEDPETGKSLNEDIVLVDEHQLVGYVVAIASPT